MFSHDGTVYQVLFEQTKESSSSSSTTTEIQAQTRRAIWSGNRLISKPPTISNIAISKHTLIKTKPATLRAPVTCQAVTDIATGRTLLLVLDLVRTLSNGIALVVYQLRSSTRELSLFLEIPLPEAIIASDSTTATWPDIQIKDGPVISCVSNGKIFICSPLDLNDTRTTGSLNQNQTAMEWTPKDIDRNVAMENNATQKPWHRTTYRARSAGSQFIAVPQSGTGPFIYQERLVHKNETITSLVINYSFNQINITNTNTTSNNNSNLSNIANIINTWCGSINATIDCVGYGNSGSGDAILCLAMTTIRHDSSVVHTLLELSLNENRYNNNNKTTTSIAKTTTTLPCRPTSMVLFSTHTSDLSIVLNLSIDIHPDVPRTVLLQRCTNRSTQNELNVIDTFNATSSVFVEDFRCQGNDDVLLFYPPSTSATTSATPSGTTNGENGENGDVSGEREEVEVDCNVVPLPVLVKSHVMIDGNGKNILSTMAVSKKSTASSSKSMKSSSSTSKKKKKQLQKEQNEKDLEERTKLKQMLSDRHVSNIDALHALERNYETSQIMYNHTLNLIGNGLSRNFTKNNNINNGSSSGGGGGGDTSSMTTSKRKRGNDGNRNGYSKLILPLHVRQEFDEKDTSTTSSSSSSSNNSKQKKKRKTKHNQQSSPSSSSSSSSSAASSSSVVEALRPISGVPTTLPSKYILLKYYVQPTLAASKINVIVELLEKTTSSTSKHKTTKQQDNDKEYLILSGFVSSEQGVNQYATESISVTKPLERKNTSTISNDGSNGSDCRTIQLSTVVDMSGVSFRSGDATVFGVLSSSSSSTASICLGGLSVAPSMLLSQISQRPASNYYSNNNNNNNNDLHVNLDHVPTVTLLISSDTSSTNGNGNAQLLSTQRIRERVYTSLVTSGNIDPKTIRIDDHLYGCRIQVPLSHGMMSGVGSSGSDGGGLRKILMSLPKGVKVTESKCTSFHLNGMKKCIDDCLKEVRGLFKTDGKNGSGEEDGDVDVAYTNVASLFS